MRNAKVVIGMLIVSLMAAAAGLGIGAVLLVTRTDQNTMSIETAAANSCRLIREILFSFHTPRGHASATTIIAYNPELANCRKYALTLGAKTP